MATSFGHKGHHQAISQKLKWLVPTVQNLRIIWDPIYIYIYIYINIYRRL